MTPPRVDVRLEPDRSGRTTLVDDARRGLAATPQVGCRRSGSTTTAAASCSTRSRRLPEYYPTRAEREILAAHAGEIVRAGRRDTLRRAGLGHVGEDPAPARRHRRAGQLERFVPFDVSDGGAAGAAATTLAADGSTLPVHAVVGDFDHHLGRSPERPGAGWWRSSAAPSATSSRPSGRGSSPARAALDARRSLPARHRPGEGPGPPRRRLRRRRRRHRRVQPQRAARAQPRARRRLRPRRVRARRRLGRRAASGSRCGCARVVP